MVGVSQGGDELVMKVLLLKMRLFRTMLENYRTRKQLKKIELSKQ